MTTMTPEDAIRAASSVARDVADGRLAPADLEAHAVTELRELFGAVVGPDDPAWDVQVAVARQVLALDGIPADELAEWLAVARQRAGEAIGEPDPADALPEPISLPSEALSPEVSLPEVEVIEPVAAAAPPTLASVAIPVPPARSTIEYDALRGWDPGNSRRR